MKRTIELAELFSLSGKDLSVAESFTGGTISAEITSIPGASNYFKEGIICYSNATKHDRLGVSLDTISKFGAVSRETALEMLKGLKTHFGIATTGNAGPTSEKNNDCGHCFIGIKIGDNFEVYEFFFEGNRKQVITAGKNIAIKQLYKAVRETVL